MRAERDWEDRLQLCLYVSSLVGGKPRTAPLYRSCESARDGVETVWLRNDITVDGALFDLEPLFFAGDDAPQYIGRCDFEVIKIVRDECGFIVEGEEVQDTARMEDELLRLVHAALNSSPDLS